MRPRHPRGPLDRRPVSTRTKEFQFLGKGKLRLTFTNASKMENFIHDGLTFRGHPLELKPISTRRWVRVRYYPYGAPMPQIIPRRGPPFI